MNQKWTQQDIPTLTGKVIIITGANSGLGLESTKALAGKGATVIMACRNPQKAATAKAEVLALHPKASLDVMPLDNASLASVKAFAEAFKAKYPRLDLLLNNAGVMAIPRQESADGFEMQIGVNHLAHFALTGHLLDIMTSTPNARIHNVSSSAHYSGSINFNDLMGKQNYSRWGAYGQSKLANVFFTFELQKRLTTAGYDTITNCSHPGLVIGQLQHNSVAQSGTSVEGFLYRTVGSLFAQDVSMGVLPQLYGSVATEAKGGLFYGPQTMNLRGYPKEQKTNKKADNSADLKLFWQLSEQLTGVSYL